MAAKSLLAAVAVIAALSGCTRVGKDYTSRMQARQQAYAAAAQIISVANEMFDTLLNAVRR